MSTLVRIGIRVGLVIGILGLVNVYLSTMTNISRTTWSTLQGGFPMLILYLCGWAGVKAYPEGKTLGRAAIAAGIAGLLGIILFNGALIAVGTLLKDSVRQFPFAAEDLVKKGIAPRDYLASPEGSRDLITSAIRSLVMVPMTAGFGAVGALLTQSVANLRKPN